MEQFLSCRALTTKSLSNQPRHKFDENQLTIFSTYSIPKYLIINNRNSVVYNERDIHKAFAHVIIYTATAVFKCHCTVAS
jgi:hypothetical protein